MVGDGTLAGEDPLGIGPHGRDIGSGRRGRAGDRQEREDKDAGKKAAKSP
jgi:hypothetical protein